MIHFKVGIGIDERAICGLGQTTAASSATRYTPMVTCRRCLAQLETVSAYFAAQGRKGGKSVSQAKAAAARKNGKKGGRPPKKPPAE